ncbi:MAG: nicotinate phosphoribosyltransferase [Mycobacteriales bacterium]
MTSMGLFTDRYELTMLSAALADGTAHRRCVFETFARRLPPGRRYGVVAGTQRLIEAIERFRFSDQDLEFLHDCGAVNTQARDWLAKYRFSGEITGYPEGELYFPGSPVLTISGSFAEAVILETLVLSILNHDCAIAAAAARMSSAAAGRPLIEMGSRRTHEYAAVAAARAAYVAGFSATSNLAAGARYGIPTQGTAAHAFTLLYGSEAEAFGAQLKAFGHETTLLVDTYDISNGIATAVEVSGGRLGAVRIDSGDLAELARQSRAQLDALGATDTRIVLSGDLDEYSIAALAAAPVDAYGVGTALVTGSGAPTAGMVYKLVEVEGKPVAKRSQHKTTVPSRKYALRRHRSTGTAIEEVLVTGAPPPVREHDRALQRPFMFEGVRVAQPPSLVESREHLAQQLVTLPWEGLRLSAGDPAIGVTYESAQ